MLELNCGTSRLLLNPEAGAALLAWQVEGQDVLRPVAQGGQEDGRGAFPILPYCGPLAQDAFSFGGEEYVLQNTSSQKAALKKASWTVAHRTDAQVILLHDYQPGKGQPGKGQHGEGKSEESQGGEGSWPFAFRAVVEVVLHRKSVDITLVVENRDTRTQPVGMGFQLPFPANSESELIFRAREVWTHGADALPLQALPCEGRNDFRKGRVLAELDALQNKSFSGFAGRAELENGKGLYSVVLETDPVFSHVRVQTAPDMVCLTPATSMPDALNRPGVAGGGVHSLKPGARLGGECETFCRV